MPLTRYQIRNEYSLADPELYRAADKDDPEALLEGVAMAGLVGVLRQLGDLAEFAAGIFHDLHEEVMATAARGHGLKVRVQQLETEVPSVERAILAQTSHSLFFPNAGVDWHPNLHMDQNLITQADLPRFLMDSYEECRGPPRLFLLDKFDVAGAGACLKRYTDPSFFRVEASSSRMTNAEVQRDRKIRKAKKRGSRWRNGETPEVNPTSHAKLCQLFLEERVENGANDAVRRVKLKRRLNGFPFDSRTGKSYMERFLKSPSPEHKEVHEITVSSPLLELPSNITSDSGLDILEISTVSHDKEFSETKKSPCSSPDAEETVLKSSLNKFNEDVTDEISEVHRLNSNFEADKVLSTLDELVDEKEIVVDGECEREGSRDGYLSDDITSELDNYTDALTTMESEMENDADYRGKRDMGFLNIEKQGSDSDATEEQQELQTNFSDSHSLVNSTVSDDGNRLSKKEISSFSNSGSLVNLTENIPSDSDASAKVLPHAEIFETEIVDISSKDQFVREDISLTQPLEHVASGAASVEVAEITNCNSEFGEPASSSCLADATPTFPPIDTGAHLKEGGLLGPEIDEVSSDCNKLVGLIHTEETETNPGDNLPSTPNHSVVPSKTREDFLPVVPAENHLMDGFDDEDPKVLSDTSLHFSNYMESPGKKSIENSLDDVLQTENMEDSCTKNLVDGQLDSPGSVNSLTEELPLGLASPLLESCDPDVNGAVSEVDDAVTSDGKVAENSIPVIESLQACNITEQLIPEMTEDVLSRGELDSAEVCTLYPEEKNLDVAFKTAVGEETDQFISNIDMARKEAITSEFGSDSLNTPESELDTNIHVYLSEETKTAQSEAVGMTSASACTTDEEINLSTNIAKLQEKSLFNLEDSWKNGLENQACLPIHLRQSVSEKEMDQQAVLQADLKSKLCNTVDTRDYCCSELPNDVPNSSMALDDENGWHPHDDTIVPSSSYQSGQDSESKSPQQVNLTENEVDPITSPALGLTELKVPPEQDFELQVVQLDGECWRADEASFESSFQLEQTQPPDPLDHERCSDASQFYPTPPPSKLSVAEFLPLTGSRKLRISEQAPDSFSSNLPAFGLFPVTTRINLEEMPPLPPLPPMQWRIGKTQHASLASERDLVKHNLDPSQPELSSAAKEKSPLGYPAIEGESTQLSNPFLPLTAVRDENSLHVYENLAGDMVHSSPFSLQVPAMLNHGNSQVDFLSSSKTESMNPYSVLPATSNQMPQNSLLALEGGTLHPSSDPSSTATNIENTTSTYDPRSSQEKLIQPLHQFTQETNPGAKKLQSSCVISEVKVVNPLDPTTQLPLVEDEQSQHALPTLEGEDGKSNGSRQMKLPRPRNPLIDAVVALDKSKLRKVTERVRPQIEWKVDERDSLLEQIRTKSFNLKPAVPTRPSIQGPKTNLKVSAILEKASAIRQAFAGSDEDDDADNWSDS